MPEVTKVLTLNVEGVCLEDVVKRVNAYTQSPNGHNACLVNVHMAMEAFDDCEFEHIVNSADLVIPDGRPIYIAQKLLGNKSAQQVRGLDLVHALCQLAENNHLKIGFYGGNDYELIVQVKNRLESMYPSLIISYLYSPPFRPLTPSENKVVVNEINASEVDILLVGIGCPKQEIWMAGNKAELSCVMVGVGAVFDFIAGEKKIAPKWMRMMSLEWLFRFLSEPGRLWKRYLKQNPRFIWFFLQQWLLSKNW
jgi:N-acetylglucosaminyldiphosphoundecaprenol N-acetyl-beta-D-mannosaminyltransferase